MIPVPGDWFQLVQPFFIITLARVRLARIRMGKREPSSPAKFAFGLFFVSADSFCWFRWRAARQSRRCVDRHLLPAHAGRVIAQPVGLSAMTKLAPTRVVGMMMGLWFVPPALGNYWAAGWLRSTDP